MDAVVQTGATNVMKSVVEACAWRTAMAQQKEGNGAGGRF